MIELADAPLVQAQYFKSLPAGRAIRLIVIHDMEAPEKPSTAHDVAKYFQHCDRQASAHYCIDDDNVVRCVEDKDIAYAAPGANHDGIQLELAGYGSQTPGQWMDNYSYRVLALASEVAARECVAHGIPPVRLTVTQVKDGKTKGICGHVDVTNAFHESDHQDPGPSFPWGWFLDSVTAAIHEITDP